MGLRTSSVIEFCVGFDNSLDGDLDFEGNVDEMLDTLDHVESGNYTLAASESNRSVSFGDVAEARMVYIEADGDITVQFGGVAATVATLLGAGGTFPGSGTLVFTLDGTPISITFSVGDLTAAAYAARINAAFALAGFATPRAVVEGGQVRLNGIATGLAGAIVITTPLASAGFAALVTINGINSIPGTAPFQLHRPADPSGAQAAEGITAFFFGTCRATSVLLSNLSTTDLVKVKVCVVGDLVTDV